MQGLHSGYMGLYEDYRDVIPVLENEMEKQMEHEMAIGMVETLDFHQVGRGECRFRV